MVFADLTNPSEVKVAFCQGARLATKILVLYSFQEKYGFCVIERTKNKPFSKFSFITSVQIIPKTMKRKVQSVVDNSSFTIFYNLYIAYLIVFHFYDFINGTWVIKFILDDIFVVSHLVGKINLGHSLKEVVRFNCLIIPS